MTETKATQGGAGYPVPDLDAIFTYHAPKGDQMERYQKLRDSAKQFAQTIVDCTPKCPIRRQQSGTYAKRL